MKKKKILYIGLICIAIYTVLAIVGIILFNYIQNNPIDNIAMPYLWENSEFEQEYGAIVHIGRNVINKTIKEESMMKVPYGVETDEQKIIVYVVLLKKDDEWQAVPYELIEVLPNEY